MALGLSSALLPFAIAPVVPGIAFLDGLIGVLAVLRSIDLCRDRGRLTTGQRLWLMFAVFDSRRATRGRPGLAPGAALGLLVAGAIAAGAFHVATAIAEGQAGGARWGMRWGGGVVFAVAAADFGSRLVSVLYRLFGIVPPPLHDAPHLSRSIGEFWSVRWNKAVGTWLRVRCWQPFARRRQHGLGVVAAFVVSALLHAYLMLVALGPRWALVMGGFFLAQVVLLAVEHALSVRRWPVGPARAWTLGTLVLASPLFVEPILRLIDPLVR